MEGTKKNRRPVGAGLSLDKFATLGVSKFDKRKKLERIQKQKLIQHSKYSKLKKKLEAQGVLAGIQVKDSVAELEALEGRVSESADEGHDFERVASHGQAGSGPHSQRRQTGEAGATGARQQPQPAPAKPDARASGHGRHGKPLKPNGANTEEQRDPGQKRSRVDVSGDAEHHPQRLRKHLRLDSDRGAGDGEVDGSDDDGSRPGGAGRRFVRDGQGGKKLSQLQRLAQKVAEEKAEKLRAKEAAAKEREERMRRIATVEKARKEEKHLHFKRNAKGQPLMRYRMDKLLSQIQKTVQ